MWFEWGRGTQVHGRCLCSRRDVCLLRLKKEIKRKNGDSYMLKMMLLIRGLPSDDVLEQRQGGVAASQI